MGYHPAVVGPIPPYSNVAIAPQNFQPSRFVISAINLGITTIVTTTTDHNYVIGQQVRLLIPPSFGSIGLSGQSGHVVSIPSPNQVELDINSQFIDPFISSSSNTKAQIVAVGDINNGVQNSNGRNVISTTVLGSFINIS